MACTKSYKKLEAWIKSMDLTVLLYEVTKSFSKEELFAMTSQLRRASSSIPANIAEGAARNHNKEYIQFLYIALGSCSELDTHIELCQRIGYLNVEQAKVFLDKIHEIDKLILGLIKYRKSK